MKDRIIIFFLASIMGFLVATHMVSCGAPLLVILLVNFVFGIVFLLALYGRTSKYSMGLIIGLGILFGAIIKIVLRILF